MPVDYAQLLEVANGVRGRIAQENELTARQARSFVRALQITWQVPPIQWRENETSSQIDDATRLIHTGQIFREAEGVESNNALDCFRRAGELLEWLARSSDRMKSSVSIELLAAAAFQLGGLPAMASALINQVGVEDHGTALFSAYLAADFDGALHNVSRFWVDNFELTDMGVSQQLLTADEGADVSWYFTVEIVRCIGLISDSLRRGNDERLELAIRKLAALDSFAVRSVSGDVSLLISLLLTVSQGFQKSSIHRRLKRLGDLIPQHRDKLVRYGRVQYSRGRGILWSSQERGIDKLLANTSFALCTPTGSGKTLIANLAIIKELLLRNDDVAPLALYLVPSRALAGEVEAKLTSELGEDFIVTGLYGGSDWGITDYWLGADKPTVLIATVEKADALMRYLGRFLARRIKLLIIDEAHQVVSEDSDRARVEFSDHASRSLRLESLVSRVINMSPDIVRVALTAVAGGAAQPVSQWIEGDPDAHPVGTYYRSTRQVIGMLETFPNRPGQLLLELMNDQPLFVRDRDAPVYLNLTTPPMPQLPALMRNSVNRFNQLSVLWTAIHLIEDGERRILISVPQQPEQTMEWYVGALVLAQWQELEIFTRPEDQRLLDKYEEACSAVADYCGDDSYELALLHRGIATNHGQMPQRIRRLMTFLIENRVCPITIATATLTEGVNLPFDIIFLASVKRQFFDSASQTQVTEPLSTGEFRNLSGRAGRPGATKGMEGLTLIAVPQRPSTTAQGQIPRQRNQIIRAKREYSALIERLSEEMQDDHVTVSPLALLLETIYTKYCEIYEDTSWEAFLAWLEETAPAEVSDEAGTGSKNDEALLADSLDELDGVLLSAVEELDAIVEDDVNIPEIEGFLRGLWRRTFANYAQIQEAWLEAAFIRRGRSLVDTIYPGAEERSTLYQFGFTPYVGRLFQQVEPAIKAALMDSADYATLEETDRLECFIEIGEQLVDNPGFGFRTRESAADVALLNGWQDVMAWWMNVAGARSPAPNELRRWQRFVSENFDFRFGVAIGAVVAKAWSDGADAPLDIPSLENWRETTGLPWFGFWAKELLRWGTLDPFVAFALARGIVRTRQEGAERRPEFEVWLLDQEGEEQADDPDRGIDPQLFLSWERSLVPPRARRRRNRPGTIELTGATGEKGKYEVIPISVNEDVFWIDASGYVIGKSEENPAWLREHSHRDHFEVQVEGEDSTVHCLFSSIL